MKQPWLRNDRSNCGSGRCFITTFFDGEKCRLVSGACSNSDTHGQCEKVPETSRNSREVCRMILAQVMVHSRFWNDLWRRKSVEVHTMSVGERSEVLKVHHGCFTGDQNLFSHSCYLCCHVICIYKMISAAQLLPFNKTPAHNGTDYTQDLRQDFCLPIALSSTIIGFSFKKQRKESKSSLRWCLVASRWWE